MRDHGDKENKLKESAAETLSLGESLFLIKVEKEVL